MIDFPSRPPTATQLADWVELNLLFSEDDRISRADVSEILDDDPDANEPSDHFKDFDWRGATRNEESSLRQEVAQLDAEGQSATERLVEEAWRELETRARFVGEGYPFAVTGRSVVRQGQPEDSCAYSFLLMLGARLSYGISVNTVPVLRPSILFERIVAVALQSYVGGRVRRFGWPYREEALQGNFREAAQKLAWELNEAEGQFLTVTADEKDHGLDVIAWSPFPDGRLALRGGGAPRSAGFWRGGGGVLPRHPDHSHRSAGNVDPGGHRHHPAGPEQNPGGDGAAGGVRDVQLFALAGGEQDLGGAAAEIPGRGSGADRIP